MYNYLGVQWLGHLETAMLFFTVPYFTLLPIMYENSSSSPSSPIVVIDILFNFCHFSKCAMVFLMVLIYIYLMTKDVVLIGYHISFLVKDIVLIYSYLVHIYIFTQMCVFVLSCIKEFLIYSRYTSFVKYVYSKYT